MLLASNVGGQRDGALGRYLMFHPVAYARGMFREELDGPRGPVGSCVYSHEFYEHRPGRSFTRGLQLQVTRENALLHQASRLEPAWGGAAHSLLREEFRQQGTLKRTEPAAGEGTRLTVGLPSCLMQFD